MNPLKRFLNELDASVEDDARRSRLQFIWFFRIMMIVAFGMTIVNILTDKQLLGWSTAVFAAVCCVNVLVGQIGKRSLRVVSVLFVPEFYALMIFFIVSGTPEGFSALWICMLPTFGLTMYGRRKGTAISAGMLAVVLFFFDTPYGNGFLQYAYTASFKLRFPMLYLSFYLVALFLETVREMTHNKLIASRQQYRYLYAHDALTGLYNRYGFNEKMDRAFAEPQPDGLALLIVDIDHFKNVNDTFGHDGGDLVLKEVAVRIAGRVGNRGDVCRWGGEEFAVLVRGWKGAAELAEEVCRAAGGEMKTGSGSVSVSVSVGAMAVKDIRGMQFGWFVRRADRCLYCAKEAGRNRSVTEIVERQDA